MKTKKWFEIPDDDEWDEELERLELEDDEEEESDRFWQPTIKASSDYLDAMWSRSGFGTGSRVDSVIAAHGMVQSFVNAFARDGRYRVVFDTKVSTAGTDMVYKTVLITPAPALDETLSNADAGRVMTGLAVHEICHPRYGSKTYWAVKKVFPGNLVAEMVSNLLDDIRIELKYVEDYPGYSGVFDPTLKYVGDGLQKKYGNPAYNGLVRPVMTDQVNLMILAIRYPKHGAWDELESERDWWQTWATQYGPAGAPRYHVQGVREALKHMIGSRPARSDDEPTAPGSDSAGIGTSTNPRTGSKEDEGTAPDDQHGTDESITADSLQGSGEGTLPHDADDLTDAEVNELTRQGILDSSSPYVPVCSGTESVLNAAGASGVAPYSVQANAERAQKVIEEQRHFEDSGNGYKVDVARSVKGLIHKKNGWRRSDYVKRSDLAARYIREAVLRSRTGHTNISHYQRRGRIDQHALHRIVSHDFRLFDRKHSESPGKYLVWIMVDKSGSMDGPPTMQSAQVAIAIADALQYVKTVRTEVWAWSDSFRQNGRAAGAARVWKTGQPTIDIAQMVDLRSRGTPDSVILSWAWRAIKRSIRSSEVPVIFFCSDGWGSYDMNDVVKEATRAGVVIRSVALGGMIDENEQLQRFGRGNFVQWEGSVLKTAKPLATMIAELVSKR